MKQTSFAFHCAIAALCALSAVTVQAVTRGNTAEGRAFVSGGVGEEEARQLQAERARYSLSVRTAAKRSGAFLADVHIRIRNAAQTTVFDQDLDGPWLMIDLPGGRYEVEARFAGQSQRQVTTIALQGHQQLDFRFASDADTDPSKAAAR